MRLLLIPLATVLLARPACSQENLDVGLLLGASYYLGDYNPSTHFMHPRPAIGLLLQRNINPFYTFRVSGLYTNLSGGHSPSDFYLPPPTPPFARMLVAMEGMMLASFLPFDTREWPARAITPYVGLGLGGAYSGNRLLAHVPMALGFKVTLWRRWAIGAEWRLHKTFHDQLDGYTNPSDGGRALTHNNDWFGSGLLVITYRVPNRRYVCPAYK